MPEEQIQCDPDAAIFFLKRLSGNGPWCLTAIHPFNKGKDGFVSVIFTVDQQEQCRAWIKLYNSTHNIYVRPNPVRNLFLRTIKKEDVRGLIAFFVDIDPRAGEDLSEEQTRIEKSLRSNTDIPPPSLIIFSGGGFQAYWILEHEIPLTGELQQIEELEKYNTALARKFGGDHCQAVNHLYRCAGTINIPDEKKLKKGRQPTLSRIVYDNPSVTYSLESLSALMGAPSHFDGQPSPSKASLYKAHKISEDLQELRCFDIGLRIETIIKTGKDGEKIKGKDDSRSAYVFDVVCHLIRSNVPEELIFSILLDASLGISESILEKGKSAERYAHRQIEKARIAIEDPRLAEFNERYAVIKNFGGKCLVIEEIYDPQLNRFLIAAMSFDNFRNAYLNDLIEVGSHKGNPVYKPAGKWWLENARRNQFERIVFSPLKEVPDAYNLWRGFAVVPRAGDCSLFLNHIHDVICSGNEEQFAYLIGWMSYCIQHPDNQGHTAIVLRGKRGTGKSFFANQFGKLFGRHYLQISDSKHLVGSFNAHLRDCILVFADEAFYAGDKKHESTLKVLITEDRLAVEGKFKDMETAPNFTHLILASNSDWVIPAGEDERRFFVLNVSEAKIQDTEYFGKIDDQMEQGGQEALLHYLQNYDLSNFNVRKVPKTTALQDQKMFSMAYEDQWILALLESGVLPHSGPNSMPPNTCLSYALKSSVIRTVPKMAQISDPILGKILKIWGCKKWTSGSKRGWIFPELSEMRASFVQKHGLINWDDALVNWSIDEDMSSQIFF